MTFLLEPNLRVNSIIYVKSRVQGEESRRAQKEHQEERRQIEEDVDREILGIKDKYERKLKQELDTNMRLKVNDSHIMSHNL